MEYLLEQPQLPQDMPAPKGTNATNLVELLKQLIKEKQYEGVALLFTSETEAARNISCLSANGMELYHDVCLPNLTAEIHEAEPAQYSCAEELLCLLAEHGHMEELLLELLEIIEEQKSEFVFTTALRALQVILLRMGANKPRALEWSLNSIRTRLEGLPLPAFLKEGYDDKQEGLLEQNEQIEKLLMYYITVELFYEPILKDVLAQPQAGAQVYYDTSINRRNVLCCFLIQMLGEPLALLDLSAGGERKTNTYTIQCARKLTEAVSKCLDNPLRLLGVGEQRVRWQRRLDATKGVHEMSSNNIFLMEGAHSSLLACSAHSSRMLMQRLRQHSSHNSSMMCNITKQRIHYRPAHAFPFHHNLHTSATHYKTTTTATIDADSSTESIDKFREREEQREREFEQQKSAEEAQNEDEAKREKIDAIRTQILEAALPHVTTLGWSRNAIVKGAEEAGFPSVVHGMFPEGGYALVSYFYGKCNDEVVRRLQEETNNGSLAVVDPLEFLVRAVRTRLEMIVPYKAQWSQALALIAMPQNAATSLAQVLTLVDDICYYAGDRSVDFGWYTRRIGLATIMKMTELFMLQDSSVDHAKTWEFLKNRMDEAVQIQLVLSQTGGMTQSFTRSFNSAFITARNILGIDYTRR